MVGLSAGTRAPLGVVNTPNISKLIVSPLRIGIRSKDCRLSTRKGVYRLCNRLYIPPPLRRHVVEELHASAYGGHFSAQRTTDVITRRFFWPHIKRQVWTIVSQCTKCQKSKPRSKRAYGLLQPILAPDRPWKQVTLDLVKDLPRTTNGLDAILVFVDRFTKMVHYVPTTKQLTAEGTAHIFKEHVFKYHGLPEVIIGDRDWRWKSHFWSTVFRSSGTKIRFSTAYHPQTDGQTDCAKRTMEEMLTSYIHPPADDWDQRLADAEFAYNSSAHHSTGRSPFYTAYGFHPRTPANLYNPQASDSVPAAQDFLKSMLEGHAAARAALQQAQQQQEYQGCKSRGRLFRRGLGATERSALQVPRWREA